MHKVKSKEEGKDQESIQSNTTSDPGHHMGKFPIWCPGSGVLFEKVTKTKENITYKRAKRSDLSQQVTTKMQHVNIRLFTGMHNSLLMDVALLSISPAGHDQVV